MFRSRFLSRLVAVVSDVDSLGAVLAEGLPVMVVEPVHAVAGGHVAIARAPERQCVDQRFAQDDFFRRDQRRFVPHSAPWPRQVQVIFGSGPQIVVDLAPVHLHHFTVEIEDRNHQRSYEVLMPGLLPEDAQLLQASALAQTLDAVLVLQAVIERAIGKAQPEVLDHLRRLQAALEEILLRSRRLLERGVVVVHHDAQQLLIVYRRLEQRRQFGHGRDFSAAARRC